MNEDLTFPAADALLLDLIRGQVFAGVTVNAGTFLPIDGYGQPEQLPFVRITLVSAKTGWVDQHTQILCEVFADAAASLPIAQAVRRQVCGTDIQTPSGVADTISSPVEASARPFTDVLDQATFSLSVICRPII
ncbi:MAG: hypothetical protein LBE25_13430 [Arthrobacter sp.]|jgi:hypothetical protein|nr:hypothetical protein [Arthrobacter sp.]